MKKKTRQKWMLLILTAALCGMLAGCGSDGDRPNVTFKNATSWGYSGSNIWLFRDGAVVVCVDEGKTPKGEMEEEIPNDAVRSVYVEEGVASINDKMFEECSNLVSVYVAGNPEIGERAFSECSSLASVELPNVTEIGKSAFRKCSSLTSVEMPNVTEIGVRAFWECSSLTSVELANVTEIGESAFYGCSSLTSVELPNVAEIGEDAFSECSSLTSVELPNVQSIGWRAFYGCSSLTSVELPSVTVLKANLFSDDETMIVGKWDDNAPDSGHILILPNVTEIGEFAFFGCRSLTSVKMPNVTEIGEKAFWGCPYRP